MGGFISYVENLVIYGWSIEIPLICRPSNMEIGLCWSKKGNNYNWTYDLTDHLMVVLETIIALAFMTYIVNLDGYELHMGDEKLLNTFIHEC